MKTNGMAKGHGDYFSRFLPSSLLFCCGLLLSISNNVQKMTRSRKTHNTKENEPLPRVGGWGAFSNDRSPLTYLNTVREREGLLWLPPEQLGD